MPRGRIITEEEKDILSISLDMRKNFIETGDISYSAEDVERMGDSCEGKIRALSPEQMELILNIVRLKNKILKKRIIIVD